MTHKEYGVTDILDVLRRAQAGDSIRRTAKATGMDRKTIGNYLRLATSHGFVAGAADDQLAEIAMAVFRAVHGPQMKPPSKTSASAPLIPHRDLISGWLEKNGLTLTKTNIKLGRMGVAVSYSSLYRYGRSARFMSRVVSAQLTERGFPLLKSPESSVPRRLITPTLFS